MGHRAPDMDAIGAAIGILKVAQLNERKGYIVLDENDSDKGIKRLMDKVKQNEELWSHFITPDKRWNLQMMSRYLLLSIRINLLW